jgi:hypothetical protein
VAGKSQSSRAVKPATVKAPPYRPAKLFDNRNEKGTGVYIYGEADGQVVIEATYDDWRIIHKIELEEAIGFCQNLKRWVT